MTNEERIRAAWEGRISGCLLGKPVEMISMREGPAGLSNFLEKSGSLPLRDYVNYMDHELLRGANKRCCAGMMDKAEVDDDITYLVLALMMMEQHGVIQKKLQRHSIVFMMIMTGKYVQQDLVMEFN